MSEWREFSRLPQSAQYWTALQDRILHAAATVETARMRRDRWFDGALAIGVLTAAIIVLLLSQPRSARYPARLQASLAPADSNAVQLLNSRQIPHISGLLRGYTPGNVR